MDRTKITWRGDELYSTDGRALARIVRDAAHPAMWRVRRPDGSLSDMVNRARAADAAELLAFAVLDGRARG